jgi:hypothetical protein
MKPRVLGAVAVVTVGLGIAGCGSSPSDTPTRPSGSNGSGPLATTFKISATVWEYGAAGIARGTASSVVFGWVQRPGFGFATGRIPVDANGGIAFNVPADTLRVNIMGQPHQPCAVTLAPKGDTTADLHVITDVGQLGNNIPASLRAQTPTISGLVYEQTSQGPRPLPGAWVYLDGVYGDGNIIASTLTDADGRYLLCGVPTFDSLVLVAWSAGFKIFFHANPSSTPTLDIELRH